MQARVVLLAAAGAALLGACSANRPVDPPPRPPAQSAVAQMPPAPPAPTVTIGDLGTGVGGNMGVVPEPRWLLTVAREIKLSSEQRATITAAARGFEERNKADLQTVAKASRAFEALLVKSTTTIDATSVERLQEQAAAADKRLEAARAAAWAPLWAKLNADQRAQVEQLRALDPFGLR